MALTVVIGPPASGKTLWVNTHAQQGDVVIDMDRIAQALSPPGADSHSYSRTLRTIAQRARRAAVDEALKYCQRVDVYLIHTSPSEADLARYTDHGARVQVVDPGREVVMARCERQRSRSATMAANRWYSNRSEWTGEPQVASREW